MSVSALSFSSLEGIVGNPDSLLENYGIHVVEPQGLEIRLYHLMPKTHETPGRLGWLVAYSISAQVLSKANGGGVSEITVPAEDGTPTKAFAPSGKYRYELVYPGEDGKEKVEHFEFDGSVPALIEGTVTACEDLPFTPYFRIG
ncbi:MAG: hypothetical protein LBS90_08650 [Oscillospiraceae bacterium]|jgi:hypothetical protein|nr:hypothetical protein [Oscillospiraceae bacterium]